MENSQPILPTNALVSYHNRWKDFFFVFVFLVDPQILEFWILFLALSEAFYMTFKPKFSKKCTLVFLNDPFETC